MAEESRRGIKVRARDVFEAYFLKHHPEEIKNILEMEDEEQHYSVYINFLSLFEEHVEVAESLLASPVKLLPVLDNGLLRAAKKLLENLEGQNDYTLKTHLHARLIGLPSCPELYSQAVPRTSDFGRLMCVVGTAVRTTVAKMLEYKKEFLCTKCKHVFNVFADHDQYYTLNKPSRCPSPDHCFGANFSPIGMTANPVHTKDYQEIKIQEQVQKMVIGTIPQAIWVTLEDDLVESCKPGDDVMVCGTVMQRWRPVSKDARPDIEMVIKANNITIRNKQQSGAVVTEEMREKIREFWDIHKSDPLSGRNVILASFCPGVYGLYVVKMAVAVVMAGGVQKISGGCTRIRGESHILLVGDPGTGKSQFLKYVNTLVPRCVLTTGIGTTNAGLTVAAVRDGGEWALEAGALVLADGGVCCIDEFNSLRETDRAAIHEAMEQQTISIAKAGLVCKLNSRCSILAATNPKGQYDPDESLTVNVALASPLLSRFDLILVLLDTKNQEWDKIVSSYILEGRDQLGGDGGCKEDWDLEQLRAYFCHVRSLNPVMTAQANVILKKYYQLQRQTDNRSQGRTTIRLLESLVRLSQGHARLMMHSEVMTQDAVVAVTLMEASMCGASLIAGINPLHTAFPQSPREEYRNQVKVILQKLGLTDILREEIERLNEEEMHHNRMPASNTSTKRPDPPGDPGAAQQTFHPSIPSKNTFRPDPTQLRTVTQIEELEEKTNKNLIMESFFKKKECKKKTSNKICKERKAEGLTGDVVKHKEVENSDEGTEVHGDHNDSVFGAQLDITFSTIVHDPVKNKKQKGTKRKSETTKINDLAKKQKISENINANDKISKNVTHSGINRIDDDVLNDLDMDFDESPPKCKPLKEVSKNNSQKSLTSTFIKSLDSNKKSKDGYTIKNSQKPSTSKLIKSLDLNKKSKEGHTLKSLDIENVTNNNEDDSPKNTQDPEQENIHDIVEKDFSTRSSSITKNMSYSDNNKFLPKFVRKEKNKNYSNSNKQVYNTILPTSEISFTSNDENLDSGTKTIKKTPPSSIAEKLKRFTFNLDNNKKDIENKSDTDSNPLFATTAIFQENVSSKSNLGEEVNIKCTSKSASNFTDKKIKLNFKTPVFSSSQSSTSSQSPLLSSITNKFAKDNQDFDDVDFDI